MYPEQGVQRVIAPNRLIRQIRLERRFPQNRFTVINRSLTGEAILLLRWFPVMCLFCWAMDWRDTTNLYWVGLAFLFVMLFGAFLLDGRRGMYILLFILFCGQDILQSQTETLIQGKVSASSIWMLKLGPLNPSWVVFSILLCFYIFKIKVHRFTRLELILSTYYFVFTGIVSFAYGNQAEGIALWTSDLRFPAFLVLGLVVFRSYLETYPNGLLPLVFCAGLCWLSRHLVDFAYLVTGFVTTSIAGLNRVSVDSAKPMVVLLLLWGIALAAVYRRFIIGSLVGGISISLVIVYMTRTLWAGAAVSIVLLAILGVKYRLMTARFILASCVAFALALWIIFSFNPEYVRISFLRAENVIRDPVLGDQVRFTSSVNLLSKMRDEGALVWGLGYGGWYRDEYVPFASYRIDIDAFDPNWISQGKFYRIHNVLLQVVFKHGIFGLLLFLYLWLAPVPALNKLAARIVSVRTKPADWVTHRSVVSWLCLGFLPTAIINLAWSAKGVLVSSFIVAVMHHLARELGNLNRLSPHQ